MVGIIVELSMINLKGSYDVEHGLLLATPDFLIRRATDCAIDLSNGLSVSLYILKGNKKVYSFEF